MRRSRWLILAAFLFAVVFVTITFIKRKEVLARNVPTPPKPLESGIDVRADDWVYTQSDGDHPRVTVRAKSVRQVQEPSVMELQGVELQLFKKDGLHFDLVKSASAQFDIAGKSLYSAGAVEISMGEPLEGQPKGRILKIQSSGVRFASDTGKATTDNAATFQFDLGTGGAKGIEYDPQTRQLHLRSGVSLDWTGKPGTRPMHVEAGEAYYHETDSKVTLQPWSKLTRESLTMDAGTSVITLLDGAIQNVDTNKARGVQDDPDRKVEFAADHLVLAFADDMGIQNIKGERNTKLVSTSDSLRTTVTSDAMNLDFVHQPSPTGNGQVESILSQAVATGKGVAEAKPIERPGELLADTRILRSDVIHLKMGADGRQIANVETDGPGTVDFLPNRVGQPKRLLKGDRIWIAYGADNRIQSFRSINATTRTDKPATAKTAKDKAGDLPPPMLTSSKDLLALFDPKTSELSRLEQNTNFRYEEGPRHATSDKALLEEAKNLITLDGSARSWDPTGSASADKIIMNQMNGDVVAEGHVATTHVPDEKPNASSSAVLSNTEVMQGRSQRMTSAAKNTKLHYEGNAVVWQGANRVEADRIDIDRSAQMLEAHGKVVSQFVDKSANKSNDKSGDKPSDKPNDNAKAVKPAAPIFTVVRAPDLTYKGDTRIAHYEGGAAMTRPDLNVTGKEILAYLNESGAENSLDKAYADGTVKILSTAEKRTRTGTSDHAEYFASEQKVVLTKGDPLLIDSLKGQTRGNQLTWWANNDRLLVNGAESKPADSLLRKK